MSWEDTTWIGLQLFAVGLLVFLNGFFVAAEFALVKIRDTQLEPLLEKGHRRALMTRFILDRLDAFLSAAQLGITLASLGLGWVGEPIFGALLAPVYDWLDINNVTIQSTISFGVGFTIITVLHIVAGEQAPKWMAIQKPLPTSLWIAWPMVWFYRLSYPLVIALNWSAKQLLKWLGVEPENEHA